MTILDEEHRQRVKAAMEQQWRSGAILRSHGKAQWLDGWNKKTGGWMLPGLEIEDDLTT